MFVSVSLGVLERSRNDMVVSGRLVFNWVQDGLDYWSNNWSNSFDYGRNHMGRISYWSNNMASISGVVNWCDGFDYGSGVFNGFD